MIPDTRDYINRRRLPSTDLSGVEISGHRIGEFDDGTPSSGTRINDFTFLYRQHVFTDWENRVLKSTVERISLSVFSGEGWDELTIHGVSMTSFDSVIEMLGSNFIIAEGVRAWSSRTNGYIGFIDRENGLELRFVYPDNINFTQLTRLDTRNPFVFLTYRSNFYGDDLSSWSWCTRIQSAEIFIEYYGRRFRNRQYFLRAKDYILIPIYFLIWTLPLALLFFKRHRWWLYIVLIIVASIWYYSLYAHFHDYIIAFVRSRRW